MNNKAKLVCSRSVFLGNAFCVHVDVPRQRRGYNDNELDSDDSRSDLMSTDTSVDEASVAPIDPAVTLPPVTNTYEDKRKEFQSPPLDSFDDDDDDFPEMQTSSTGGGGGSNIISLLNLVNGLFPSSGGANFQRILRSMLREYIRRYPQPLLLPQNILLRRQGIFDNEIDIDETFDLRPPPFQRQESDENGSNSDSNVSDTKESDEGKKSKEKSDEHNSNESNESDENDAGESLEDDGDDNDNNDNNASQQGEDSKPASDGNGDDNNSDNDSDYDDDEPPEGDGQGGGILGILAGLSGDNGESDLGSLLATISGIVVNLSGDGIDVNSLIASGIGLFVGLLSEGEENPGTVIAQYLLTSLDTITGGGAKKNGAFFGKFLSKLISGTSAGEAPEGASDESGEQQGPKDSAGFLASLLMGLSGDMSKTSSAGSSKW
ncbi:hyphally regulated cell wall protein 3-like [Leguminivora glycinivorella]|uniref:hyphally regulated cell wall protein 3-like n=1 Tax=Leguminivora glycinivorella TaxID=1035111 RepID=UPI00200BBD29|nr:hyphally regulated cell wall protein 3-like [Leguminivora glycinivorella]